MEFNFGDISCLQEMSKISFQGSASMTRKSGAI